MGKEPRVESPKSGARRQVQDESFEPQGGRAAEPSQPTGSSEIWWWNVVVIILVWKLTTLAIAVVSRSWFQPEFLFPGRYDLGFDLGMLREAARSAFTTWDSHHYLYVADHGYQEGHPWNAFYPALVLSTRLLTNVTGDSLVSAMLISNLASLAGLCLLFRLVERCYSRRVAMLTLALLLAFPTAFYLNLVYSESLFLLLAVAFFYFSDIEKQRPLPSTLPPALPAEKQRPSDSVQPPATGTGAREAAAALCAFLLPWTRSVGIFIVAPQAVSLIEAGWRRASETGRQRRLVKAIWRWQTLYLLAPVAGLAAYFLFMQLEANDAFSAFKAQEEYIGQKSISSLLHPDVFLGELFTGHLFIHDYVDSALDRLFFVWFLGSLPLVYRRVDRPMFVFCLALGLVPMLGTFMSYMRYVMVAFPMFIAYASWLEEKSPVWLVGILIPMALVQSLFLSLHTLDHWVA